jgi:hypothetical protein
MSNDGLELRLTWRRAAIAVAGVAALGLVALVMLGSQVSGVLSTVGGAVPPPFNGAGQGEQPGGGPDQGSDDGTGAGDGTGGSNGAGDGSGDQTSLLDVTRPDLLIIKTGEIAIQVNGIDPALNAADRTITGMGGYTSGSERSGDGEHADATARYRIPAARWEEALAGIRGLGAKVISERSSTEDVTTKVVDLGARITNLQATETALQRVMERATEIKDILSVQAELTKVREQLETLSAEKTQVEGKAAFSTLTVTFSMEPDPVTTQRADFSPEAEVERASAKLVKIIQRVTAGGIWFAIVWLPVLLGLGSLLTIAVWGFRRAIRRIGPAPVPSGQLE